MCLCVYACNVCEPTRELVYMSMVGMVTMIVILHIVFDYLIRLFLFLFYLHNMYSIFS